MEEVRRILSGYMRPSPSPDEDVAPETASVSAIFAAAAIAANGAAAPEAIPPNVPALSLGIWRPWGVGLSLRLSDVLEVMSFDFNCTENDLSVSLMTWGLPHEYFFFE